MMLKRGFQELLALLQQLGLYRGRPKKRDVAECFVNGKTTQGVRFPFFCFYGVFVEIFRVYMLFLCLIVIYVSVFVSFMILFFLGGEVAK